MKNPYNDLKTLLLDVDTIICDYIKNEEVKFPSYRKLLNRFYDCYDQWNKITECTELYEHKDNKEKTDEETKSIDEKIRKRNREVTEIINELIIAKMFLQEEDCAYIDYEIENPYTKESIDFFLRNKEGEEIYCDVKTIHPDDIDKWDQYEKLNKQGRFPLNASYILNKHEMGGLLWHYSYASRGRMLEHITELEKKIEQMRITNSKKIMIFCGDGFRLPYDELEDFSDFYHSGIHRYDDFMVDLEKHYIKQNKIVFLGNINFIAYLERKRNSLNYTFDPDVRGPRFFGNS